MSLLSLEAVLLLGTSIRKIITNRIAELSRPIFNRCPSRESVWTNRWSSGLERSVLPHYRHKRTTFQPKPQKRISKKIDGRADFSQKAWTSLPKCDHSSHCKFQSRKGLFVSTIESRKRKSYWKNIFHSMEVYHGSKTSRSWMKRPSSTMTTSTDNDSELCKQ